VKIVAIKMIVAIKKNVIKMIVAIKKNVIKMNAAIKKKIMMMKNVNYVKNYLLLIIR
jgi:hypothetical protein